jgi:prepilin-type N-terminal cleavage/methylation domain-containing protein
MSSGGNRAGFTLIEMLVALTIIVAILAMVYGSVAATTRSIDASGARLAGTERACFTLRLMTRQIRCAYAPSPAQSPSSGSRETRMGGDVGPMNDGINGPLRVPAALFRGNSRDPHGEILSFITSSGLGAGPDAPRGLFRVSYLYDRASSTLSISRQQQADSAGDRTNAKHSDLLLSNVTGIELKFHDGRQWQPTWDIAQRHELPRAVKLEIAVADGAGRSHSLGTTIPVVQETYPESKSTKQAVAAGQP